MNISEALKRIHRPEKRTPTREDIQRAWGSSMPGGPLSERTLDCIELWTDYAETRHIDGFDDCLKALVELEAE